MEAPRVERIDLDGRAAWRKRYGAPGRHKRLAVLRWVAHRLGADPLIAPLPLPADAACRTEQAMIGRLRRLGVHAPEILAAADAEIVLSDLGPTLSERCRAEPDPARRERLLAAGFAAIGDLHARGGYLSQAFARNLALDEAGRVGFIDLEEDPATVMPLAAAQARDVLLYVHSTARFLADAPERYAALLRRHIATEPVEVRAEVARVAQRLRWLAPLAGLGGARGRALGQALRALARLGVVVLMAALIGGQADDLGLALIDLMF